MHLVELGIRAMLCVVFATAAAAKLRSRAAFDAFVDTLPTRGRLGAGPSTVLAAAVAALELTAAALLIARPLAGLAIASGLLAGFTALMVAALRAGAPVVCRCFGARPRPIHLGHVVRNAVLLAASVVGASASWLGTPGTDPAIAAIVIGIAAILGVAVTRWDDLAFLFGPARLAAEDRHG